MKKLVLMIVVLLLIGTSCQEQNVASEAVIDDWSSIGCDMDGDGDIEFDDMALYIDCNWLEKEL